MWCRGVAAQTVVLLVDEPGADLDREHLTRLLARGRRLARAVLRDFPGSRRQSPCPRAPGRFTWNALRALALL